MKANFLIPIFCLQTFFLSQMCFALTASKTVFKIQDETTNANAIISELHDNAGNMQGLQISIKGLANKTALFEITGNQLFDSPIYRLIYSDLENVSFKVQIVKEPIDPCYNQSNTYSYYLNLNENLSKVITNQCYGSEPYFDVDNQNVKSLILRLKEYILVLATS